MGIQIEGLDELIAKFEDSTLDDADAKAAVRKGAQIIAKSIESNSPKKSGKMGKVKVRVRTNSSGSAEANIRAGAHYSIFNEYGTSKMRQNMGYFAKSVSSSSGEAIEVLKNELLKKIL